MDILEAIWSKQRNGKKPYFCVSTKHVKTGKWKDHFFRWPRLSKLDKILEEHPTKEYNLYFCPLPFSRPYRRKEYVMGSNWLWADIDDANPEKMDTPPHILWESSPGRWAGLWRMERWIEIDELEDLNRRMTYGTDSDKAGWDLTQVLRIPGTRNHKYKGSPKGKLNRVDLKGKLKIKDVPRDIAKSSAGQAVEVYKKWEKKLRGTTRSALTATKATAGKRSDVIWKLYHQLFDAGVPVNEIKLLIKESVWNKYRGRRDEDKQLSRDIEKCLKEKLTEHEEHEGKAALAGAEEIYEGISAADVEVSEIDWIWYPYISRGCMTIVEGDPGLGKSYLMQMVSKAIVDGGRLPSEGGLGGTEKIKRGNVLYFSIEDDAGTVIVPRLRWNKCRNLKNFHIYDRKLTMDEDGLRTAEYLVEKHKIDMVVFDTLNYFVGGIDVHRANEVAQQLEHFTRLASNHDIAVVVLRHLTKNSSGTVKASYRGQGSIAFTGTAREVLTVGMHPDDHDLKILAVTKLNLEAMPKALGYRILKADKGSRFEWSEDMYDLTSDDIVDVKPKGKGAGRPANAVGDAIAFIEEKLADGPMESNTIKAMAETASIAPATLLRAKKELKIKSTRRESAGETRWFWSLSK